MLVGKGRETGARIPKIGREGKRREGKESVLTGKISEGWKVKRD